MDLLDRLIGHDLWTTRQLLLQCRALSDAQLDQAFDIDSRSLRQCFMHMLGNMQTWTDLLYQRPPRAAPGWGAAPTVDALLTALDAAGQEFTALAQSIAREQR